MAATVKVFVDHAELNVQRKQVKFLGEFVFERLGKKRSDFILQVEDIDLGDVLPRFWLAEFINRRPVVTHGNVSVIELADLGLKNLLQFVVKPLCKVVSLILRCLQSTSNVGSHPKQSLGERCGLNSFALLGVLAEVFEVAAPVEDVEKLFVLTVAEDVGA